MAVRFAIRCLSPLLLALLVTPAFGAWPDGQVVLWPGTIDYDIGYARIFRASDGEPVFLYSSVGGNSYSYDVARATPDGYGPPATGAWATPSGYAIKSIAPSQQGFTADDSSGFWHAWYSSTYGAVVAHVLPDGTQEPPIGYGNSNWSTGLSALTVDAAPGPGSDVYVAGFGRVQRFTRAGVRAAGWPANGLAVLSGVSSLYSDPAIVADGAGGAVTFEARADMPRAGRVDAGGTLHAGWPAGGLVVGWPLTAIGSSWPVTQLVRSDSTHFVAMWVDHTDGTASGPADVYLQRFSLDAVLDGTFSFQILSGVSLDFIDLLADGQGGVYLLSQSGGVPAVAHILADGNTPAGTDGSGVSPLPPGASYQPAGWFSGVLMPTLAADATPDGGLVFAWSDTSTAPDSTVIRVRWLRSDLAPDPVGPAEGLIVAREPYRAGPVRAVLADTDGAYVAWESWRDLQAGTNGRLAAVHVSKPSNTGVEPPLVAAGGLALAAPAPNPVRTSLVLRFTLPDDRPARLELFDVSGRRVRAAEARGAGPHVRRFDDLGDLAPGLYLARLSQGGASRTTRFVRVR